MPLWRTIPVTDQPELTLRNWTIRQLPGGTRHFVGYVDANREGRVSSPIVEFDPATMRGRTHSGRVYGLVGGRGFHPDAEYVWGAWCRINKVDPDAAVEVDPAEVAEPAPGH